MSFFSQKNHSHLKRIYIVHIPQLVKQYGVAFAVGSRKNNPIKTALKIYYFAPYGGKNYNGIWKSCLSSYILRIINGVIVWVAWIIDLASKKRVTIAVYFNSIGQLRRSVTFPKHGGNLLTFCVGNKTCTYLV